MKHGPVLRSITRLVLILQTPRVVEVKVTGRPGLQLLATITNRWNTIRFEPGRWAFKCRQYVLVARQR